MQELKKKYHDARHHCYAYRLGIKADKSFSNDDGEPSHSAGTPILSAIRSAEMSNVLVVVVRYFGGTKLGIRGLIDAYGTAAKEALTQAESYPMIPMIRFKLPFSYEQTSALNKLLHPFSYTLEGSSYTETCEYQIAIKEVDFPDLKQSLEKGGYTYYLLS